MSKSPDREREPELMWLERMVDGLLGLFCMLLKQLWVLLTFGRK